MGEAKLNAAQKLRQAIGVPGDNGMKHFRINYAYNESHMIVQFDGVKVDNLTMTVEQMDEMIKSLQGLREAFLNRTGAQNG